MRRNGEEVKRVHTRVGALILAWALGASASSTLTLAAFALCAVALNAPSTAQAAAAALPSAADLAADGRAAAASGRVIVVLYSTPGCPWCHKVREGYLKPMLANADEAARVIIREIDVASDARLIDFDGAATSQREFAARRGIRFVPNVAFFGPRGEAVADALVGFTSADFYGAYLDARIDAGLAKLRP